MEENKDIPDLSPSDAQKLKMTPPENAWNRLDAELARRQAVIEQKKANRFRLLFIITGLLLITTIGYFSLKTTPVKTIVQNQTITSTPSTNSSDVNTVNQNNTIQPAQNRETTHSTVINSTQQSSAVSDIIIKTKRTNNSGKVASHKLPGILNSTSTEKLPAKTGNSPTSSPDAFSNNNQQALNNPISYNDNTSSTSARDKGITEKNSNSNSFPPENVGTTRAAQIAMNNSNASPEAVNISSTGTNNDKNQPISQNIKQAGLVAKENPDSTKVSPAAPTTNPQQEVAPNTFAPAHGANLLSRISIAAFFSPNYTDNHLTQAPNGKYPPSAYYANEKIKFTYSAGFSARFDLTGYWSVGSGVTYATNAYNIYNIHGGVSRYNSNNQQYIVYPTSCGMVYLPNTSDYSNAIKAGTLNASCYQVVKFITVPLTVRFQVPVKKFLFYANAGGVANFVIQEKAKFNFDNSQTTVINQVDNLNGLNWGYIAGLGVQYNIYRHLGIFAEPQFRGSINSLTHGMAVYCYPFSIGVNAGVAFHF